jgi:2-polyprenyl-3-methyl-5-hydroxy-6-metoxy-1,4-benzoquinol methylase
MSNSMMWRQKYINSEIYQMTMDDGHIVNIRQFHSNHVPVVDGCTYVRPAQYVLAKYLEFLYERNMTGLNVCDIGSVTGCTGLYAATLGAKVSITDIDDKLDLLKENIAQFYQDYPSIDRNHITYCSYDCSSQHIEILDTPFDIILVSDCSMSRLHHLEELIQVSSLNIK